MKLFYTWNSRQPGTWGGGEYLSGEIPCLQKELLLCRKGAGWWGGFSFQKINGNNQTQDFVLVVCRVFAASVPSQHA